ncbi:MAG: hypothetical protein WB869_15010, partial [Candidatus Acidiferrales bacterium]
MKIKFLLVLLVALLLSPSLVSTASATADSGNMTELQTDWRMTAASDATSDGAPISQPSFNASSWYSIRQMPATVLQTLEDNGVYKNLYYGMNLSTEVPHDLWKKDWWYRTTFAAPSGQDGYSLIFKGINYRADIWLNGHKVADHSQVVG